ncbi:uncharacterized protein LOC128558768 [Mercenaria mercenaria]|uniref:uncharacterized protein LOC128558768 n=1 Tax=Mercenaria mercenaria TaxID=6596 RepID=UPI00234FAE9B|nr:uncharacterized protein LOC128558768 [Mercenaria mercenaria]
MQVRELQGNNILLHETMRSHDLCNTVTSIVIVRGPGVFMGKDLVGNNWSGKIILVATDYTSFAINWGCTKWSVFNDGLCEDPSVYVKTRELNPIPKVLRRIETVLQNTWGISVNQLRRISNDKPCSTGGSSWIKKNGNVG